MSEKIYVTNLDKFVYEVGIKKFNGDFEWLITLNLVAGWDYISEESDIQGYVDKYYFVEDLHYEDLILYPLQENVIERLSEEGYKIVKLEDLNLENLLHAI